MSPNDRTARVRCPSPACGRTIEIVSEWLGRNMYCPACGVRMTARPVSLEGDLRSKEARVRGGEGAAVARIPLVALVDNVRSLWNVGSIFRTADACGVRHLFLTGISGCPPRPEISKTALGAEEAVAWSYHAVAAEALGRLCGEGYTPVAVETSEQAASIGKIRWPERVCLVMGNEVAGVSPELLAACPIQVKIPMFGVKNSLNVAVAFGIVAFLASAALRSEPRYADHRSSAADGRRNRPG